MLGLNLLVRLGRTLFSGPLADSGVLPASYYRHLALAAMEEENYPEALGYLKWAQDRLLTQVLILRLRLLAARHDRQRRGLEELLASPGPNGRQETYRSLLAEEERALELLGKYEEAAQALLR
ncbi:MAG: hypothetical protein FJ134_02545 [Deltaproteobacteria bacterium]|nr:hypothetical protein [Deltaproteobacteria bacterium]